MVANHSLKKLADYIDQLREMAESLKNQAEELSPTTEPKTLGEYESASGNYRLLRLQQYEADDTPWIVLESIDARIAEFSPEREDSNWLSWGQVLQKLDYDELPLEKL